jgi:hypothetical protein
MKIKNVLKIFILILGSLLILHSCREEIRLNEFKEISEILQSMDICLNIDEKSWNDSIRKNANLQNEWRYFCDTANFKIHKLGPLVPLSAAFLLEVRINHGSGEYDNYIIKRTDSGYKITCEFKGYLDSILQGNIQYNKFIYHFNTTTVKFDGNNIVTDTILSFDVTECKDVFEKGTKWCE